MKNVYKSLTVFLFIFLTSSCGYRFVDTGFAKQHRNLFIPFVEGDLDGKLTSEIVFQVSSLTPYRFVSNEGEAQLILKAKLIKHEQMNIGYQYDVRETTQSPINRLVPNEARKELVVEISLMDSRSGSLVRGPFHIQAFADYDFVNSDSYQALSFIDSSGVPQSVLAFSLGQLDSSQGSSDIVLELVYKYLAIKIAQGLERL